MNDVIGKPEKATQNRIVTLFKKELGYTYLGDLSERENNSNIEAELLTTYLSKAGYKPEHINAAIHKLQADANNHNRSLYQNNKEVYSLLRYGAKVKVDVSEKTQNVYFINWKEPLKNDFSIAEEVSLLKGNHERRPDLVLYVNGIAFGVIELKNSRVSIGDGIGQLLSNQKKEFNEWFFSTVQIVFAGSDSEGLKYGTIETQSKYFLSWKEDEEDNDGYKLDKYLLKMCDKERIIEILHDFVLFDGGVKKLPRVHQYFGIKSAQEHIKRREGGIIWHTQGSGKSIVMVMLAKWILENNPNARIVIVTDRNELDEQIEGVFRDAGENSVCRTSSGRDLITKLSQPKHRLLCTLVHKFGQRGVENWEEFIKELKSQPSKAIGDMFIFVDECHRTQSGKLHEAMTAFMPNALFIGFTGTPLLKDDKEKSFEVFGRYIHTYKFSEAVEDKVVLDLLYEARDIDQRLGSKDKIDEWFEVTTNILNQWQKDELKKHWATMQKVVGSKSRMDKVVADIDTDFRVRPRLISNRGNALLVASSIYEACKYYNLFQDTQFKGKCAIVTSYDPNIQDVTKEDTGANTQTDKEAIYKTYEKILDNIQPDPQLSKAETYEKRAKALFVDEPANMRLLIVVDKLLTGFDAPSCTYLYIDKSMQDHGLFQAICRTNRLDGEDKDFGYIIDYKDLFKKVEKAISIYSSELDHSSGGASDDVLIKSRLAMAKETLDKAIEKVFLLFEAIPQPKGEFECIRYFCGNTEKPDDLREKSPIREGMYHEVAGLIRAYANMADSMVAADYTKEEIESIKSQVKKATEIRSIVRRASGEELDLKPYEADMRLLIDRFIVADDPRKISPFDEKTPLIDLIVKTGIADAIAKKFGNKNPRSVAEGIENNLRSVTNQKKSSNPIHFDKMSKMLDEIIKFRKENAEKYEEYLKKIAELAKNIHSGTSSSTPLSLKTAGQRALYDSLDNNEALALEIDSKVKNMRPDDWRGVKTKEQSIKKALNEVLNNDEEVERIFLIIKNQQEY